MRCRLKGRPAASKKVPFKLSQPVMITLLPDWTKSVNVPSGKGAGGGVAGIFHSNTNMVTTPASHD